MIIQLIAVVFLVGLDQITKLWTLNYFTGGVADIQIIDGIIELTFVKNTGAAFGIFSDGTIFLIILVSVVIVMVVFFQRKIPREKYFLPLHILVTFILAGAIGNLIDRIRLQYVVDMIHFYWFEFPVFNVADIYVTCSAAILMILLLTKYKDLEI